MQCLPFGNHFRVELNYAVVSPCHHVSVVEGVQCPLVVVGVAGHVERVLVETESFPVVDDAHQPLVCGAPDVAFVVGVYRHDDEFRHALQSVCLACRGFIDVYRRVIHTAHHP